MATYRKRVDQTRHYGVVSGAYPGCVHVVDVEVSQSLAKPGCKIIRRPRDRQQGMAPASYLLQRLRTALWVRLILSMQRTLQALRSKGFTFTCLVKK